MKKKSFAFAFSIVLTVALIICMMPVTSSAADISSQLASALDFYVDFRTENDSDIQGNYNKVADNSDEVIYEDDTVLGAKVAIFGEVSECYCVTYEAASGEGLSGYDLTDGITLEVYVYINPDTTGNMTFIESAGGSLHLQQYDSGTDHCVGLRCGDVPGAGENGDGGDAGYVMRNAYADRTLDTGKWVHIVGVSDGATNKFYIDGQEAASVDRIESTLKGVNNNTDPKLTVGESIFGSMFGETAVQGKIAYAKLYKAAASAEDITALYANAASEAGAVVPSVTDEPTAEPTDEPTAEPTDAPTAEPTATPAPAATGMDSTLLIIIIVAAVIVIAAVVVLVIVLMKKSKTEGNTAEAPAKETPAEETKAKDENKSEE